MYKRKDKTSWKHGIANDFKDTGDKDEFMTMLTVCLEPIYIVTYYIYGLRLLGQTVQKYYLFFLVNRRN